VYSRPLLGCLAVLCLDILVVAQPPPSPNPAESRLLAPVATIARRVDEVNVAFTVTDHKGRFISNLREDDFRLFDNHLAPKQLTYFRQRSDLPLHLAVLIDASSSVRACLKFEQNAAFAFLKKVVRPGTDKAFVVAFNDRANVIAEVADNRSQISKAVKRVKADGNTSLYDAITFASGKLRQIPEHGITRRAIVLISDGVDTASQGTLHDAHEAASLADVSIFALSTNMEDLRSSSSGDTVLQELATTTGGRFLAARDESQIYSGLNSVEKALHNQYVVAYRPTAFEADGSYRTLELVPVKNGLRTNCRKGYYAKRRSVP
jgi:Ca-activated chloride channel family protein